MYFIKNSWGKKKKKIKTQTFTFFNIRRRLFFELHKLLINEFSFFLDNL